MGIERNAGRGRQNTQFGLQKRGGGNGDDFDIDCPCASTAGVTNSMPLPVISMT